MFECILKEPEDVKKPEVAPSPPAEKPGVPKKGTSLFVPFVSVLASCPRFHQASKLHQAPLVLAFVLFCFLCRAYSNFTHCTSICWVSSHSFEHFLMNFRRYFDFMLTWANVSYLLEDEPKPQAPAETKKVPAAKPDPEAKPKAEPEPKPKAPAAPKAEAKPAAKVEPEAEAKPAPVKKPASPPSKGTSCFFCVCVLGLSENVEISYWASSVEANLWLYLNPLNVALSPRRGFQTRTSKDQAWSSTNQDRTRETKTKARSRKTERRTRKAQTRSPETRAS